MYDLERFGLDMLVAVLKTHPLVRPRPALPVTVDHDRPPS
jgi:hypothetical protein